jgi:hypothetical protein
MEGPVSGDDPVAAAVERLGQGPRHARVLVGGDRDAHPGIVAHVADRSDVGKRTRR